MLTREDAEAYFRHRLEALRAEPLSFSASPEDDRAGSVESVQDLLDRAPHSVVLGAFIPELLGSVGLYRDSKRKVNHKAHIWGLYVRPTVRQQGVGRQLMLAAIKHASTFEGVTQLHLTVSDRAQSAQRLYSALGFKTWGTEHHSLRFGGEWASEDHMVLDLERGPGSGVPANHSLQRTRP
jgi:ribosomal protein S18 acetylase RimI-like enzyme